MDRFKCNVLYAFFAIIILYYADMYKERDK